MEYIKSQTCVDNAFRRCQYQEAQNAMGGILIAGLWIAGGVGLAFVTIALGPELGIGWITANAIRIGVGIIITSIWCGAASGAEDDYNKAMETNPTPKDPIIFDLNGDGIKTTDYIGYFDYNNDGFAELTKWVNSNDGILVVDKNNNEKIDNGTEVVLYENLEEYDSNNDGIIDANDMNCSELKILKGDGTLLTLEEAGIESINLNIKERYSIDENGNIQLSKGTFQKIDGTISEYGEFGLLTNKFNTISMELLDIPDEIEELPEIMGTGKVYSLQQSMVRDESLKMLVESFIEEQDSQVRMNLLEQIILKWTNSENVEEGSRGENIDAKHLNAIEQFMGYDFISNNTTNEEVPSNPNLAAGQLLTSLYEKFKLQIYAQLMVQSHLKPLFNNTYTEYAISVNKSNYNINFKLDLTPIIISLQAAIAEDEGTGKELVYEVAKMLKGLGIDKYSNFFDPKDEGCFYTRFTKEDRELKWQIDTIGKVVASNENWSNEGTAADDAYRMYEGGFYHALSGDDVIYGSDGDDNFSACSGDDIIDAGSGNDVIDTHAGNDIIYAGAGNDIIHAAWGDDIIYGEDGDDIIYPDHGDDFNYSPDGDDIIIGGKGNDIIHSMTGNDTFIFNLGDGQDTVYEHQGIDTFYFGNNISWDSLIFQQSGNDMIIKIQDTTDQITVKDWFLIDQSGIITHNNHQIEIFEFADGTKHFKDEINIGDNSSAITYNMEEFLNFKAA